MVAFLPLAINIYMNKVGTKISVGLFWVYFSMLFWNVYFILNYVIPIVISFEKQTAPHKIRLQNSINIKSRKGGGGDSYGAFATSLRA